MADEIKDFIIHSVQNKSLFVYHRGELKLQGDNSESAIAVNKGVFTNSTQFGDVTLTPDNLNIQGPVGPQGSNADAAGLVNDLQTYVDANFFLKNDTTSNLTEGSNLYFTQDRARQAISVSGSLAYANTTGEILAEAQPGCSRMAFVGCTYHCG